MSINACEPQTCQVSYVKEVHVFKERANIEQIRLNYLDNKSLTTVGGGGGWTAAAKDQFTLLQWGSKN